MSYKKPEMEVIRFESADIVAASVGLSGFGDDIAKNGKVYFNGQTYTIDSTNSINSLFTNLSAVGVDGNTEIYNNRSEPQGFKAVLKIEAKDGTGVSSKAWNGSYTYDKVNNIFTKVS